MITYGAVEEQADRIVVIACGPSVRDVPLERFERMSACIIAINGAIKWLPSGADVWFTLDADDRTRPLMRYNEVGTTYYAAVPPDYGEPNARCVAHRAPAETGITYLRRIEKRNKQEWVPLLSEDPSEIHTGNSAWGGLQVAYHMRPKKILLLGVDATSQGYAYNEGRPRDLSKLPFLMGTAVSQLSKRGIMVVNGSQRSNVRCFTRMAPVVGLDWLEGAFDNV